MEFYEKKACWASSLTPKMLRIGDSFTTSPKHMAGGLDNFFVRKVKNICKNLTGGSGDPLGVLKKVMNDRLYKDTVSVFEFKEVDHIKLGE